jgi:two-component system CheB/CheR fusion protein
MMDDVLLKLGQNVSHLMEVNRAIDEAIILAITNQQGMITFANKKFCDISQYSQQELIGQNHRIVNSGFHPPEFFKDLWRTIGQGRIWKGEIRNRAKNGDLYWVDTTIVPCLDEKGKPYQYIAFRVDITARKQVEEQMRRLDQLQIAGQISASIAHEIRNPLAAIQWTLLSLSNDAADREHQLSLVQAELTRIDAILTEFLTLSKKRESVFFEIDLPDLVCKTVDIVAAQARQQGITLDVDVHSVSGKVWGDEHQLRQVFLNLMKNALESMEVGGRLTVRAEQSHDSSNRPCISIAIADSGCGMTAWQLSNLERAFFTTKPGGTGLGLTVCHQILHSHQGVLNFRSQVGEGTTATVTLPLYESSEGTGGNV